MSENTTQPPIETRKTDSGEGWIYLNRPRQHNALNETLLTALKEALDALDDDPGVRVVVLAARGRSFCAGADLNRMRHSGDLDDEQNLADATRLATLLHTLDTLSKPTVARIHGPAYGGGVGLCACCDIAIAGAGAHFRFSEVRLGILPAVIAPFVVRAIGHRQARRYFHTAESFDTNRARDIGLIHEAVADEDLDQRVAELTAELKRGGPAAIAASKRLLKRLEGAGGELAILSEAAEVIARARAGDEGREGLQAFLDKRKPSWRDD